MNTTQRRKTEMQGLILNENGPFQGFPRTPVLHFDVIGPPELNPFVLNYDLVRSVSDVPDQPQCKTVTYGLAARCRSVQRDQLLTGRRFNTSRGVGHAALHL